VPWFPELFTANTRASGASLAYQISAMGVRLYAVRHTLLFEGFGWVGPALLFSGYAAIGLVAALVTRETWGSRERHSRTRLSRSRIGQTSRWPRRPITDDTHGRNRPPPYGGGGRLPHAAPRAEHGRSAGPGLCRSSPRRR